MHSYGGGKITNYGSAKLRISYKDKSIVADFKIVKAPGNSSILGCRQALELGMLQLDVNSITRREVGTTLQGVVKHRKLTKSQVLQEYKDCFDKIGRKIQNQADEDAQPVIYPPRSVPVHMPLYKAEIDNMLKDGIISPVTEPTDSVNSIVCNIKETVKGRKVRLCLDPKELNKNIRR